MKLLQEMFDNKSLYYYFLDGYLNPDSGHLISTTLEMIYHNKLFQEDDNITFLYCDNYGSFIINHKSKSDINFLKIHKYYHNFPEFIMSYSLEHFKEFFNF